MLAIGRAIKKAMEQRSMSVEQLTKATSIAQKELIAICEERKDPSLNELVILTKVLQLDINELLHIQIKSKDTMQLEDEMEIEVNHIAREIPKSQRNRFVQAVKYLAECFDNKEE